ncbi:unnamed protein product [Chondrus crispus]|uniref:Mut7-C RNAse domain-containing protein n=1 Tax=Chondrus crispus TaxID=2769 RepID=R7QU85_CHOCR|nr:unnamed protein product [Chondrus crispus]CDF40915.1 unnamed protein product [Chondrus crispus]|eukprot:XP_005711209.1 unnamed protein product [Chondrus crispus]
MAAVTGACVSAAVRGAVCGVRRARGEARFLCDGSLSRLARWLRLLGVDAALEEGHGGRRNVDALFERARRERRILVTSSTTVCRRANCPESFFVRPGKMGQMETCLTTLLNCYGVRLEEDMILSMCGKCGEAIERRGEGGPKDTELFTCGGCGWVYWESTSGKGSSVKARKLAKRLYKAVEEGRRKAGAEVRRRERCSNEFRGGLKDCDCTAQEGRRGEYWLRYESAFTTVHGREPEYTNVNGDFKGTLDYIFVGGTAKVTAAEVIETVVGGGWPSDHSMVKAEVSVEELPVGRAGFSRTRSCPLW